MKINATSKMALLIGMIVGCSAQPASPSKGLADQQLDVNSLYEQIQKNTAGFDVEAYRKLSPSQHYKASILNSASDKGQIFGASIVSLHSYLVHNQGTALSYLGEFKTYGAKLDMQKVSMDPAKISRSDVQDFVDTLRKIVSGEKLGLVDGEGFALNPYDDSFHDLSCSAAYTQDRQCDVIALGNCVGGDKNRCSNGEQSEGNIYAFDTAIAACHAAYSRVVGDAGRHCGPRGTSTDGSGAGSGSGSGSGGASQGNTCDAGAVCNNVDGNNNALPRGHS